jgi:CAAX protease family protein
MSRRQRRRATTVALLCSLATSALASSSRDLSADLEGSPDPAALVRHIDAQTRAAFDATLHEYEARIEASAFDVVDQLQRCRFIDEFVSTYEYASFIEELAEQADQCREAVAKRFPQHPEVLLMQLESTYGEEQLAKGAEMFRMQRRQAWTSGQLGRLYTLLARSADSAGKKDQALDFALHALENDDASDVRMIAATHLADRGDTARAVSILTAPVDGAHPEDYWTLVRRMSLLVRLGAHDHAMTLHSQLEGKSGYNHLEAARALRAAGSVELARKELQRAADSNGYGPLERKERFRLEFDVGTPAAALAAYESWRDQGWQHDPLAINRIALATRSLALPWQARDLLGILALMLALAGMAAAAALPLSLVHYRGLARRARSGDAYPTSGWQLRHAWAALFAFGSASLLALYTVGPIDLSTNPSFQWGIDASGAQLARIALAESLLAIALLVPLGRMALRLQPAWWGTRWSLGRSILTGVALGVAFRLPLLLTLFAGSGATPLLAPDDPLWQLLGEVRSQFGILAALWIIAVAAPVIEEFIFRGVLLKAFSAHLGFGWANALQAAMFSAMHMNLKAAVLLFVVGAVCGRLAQRSGGLAAPMAMHAAFNLIAGVFLLAR